MKRGYLSNLFDAVAHKRLSAVEAERHRSNQHEFDGVTGLKQIFGADRKRFKTLFIYLDDENEETISEGGFLTWYDSREAHPNRSEFRLYFPDTVVSDKAAKGDMLVIGRRANGELLVIITKAGSTAENQMKWLFAIREESSKGYSIHDISKEEKNKLNYAAKSVLQSIGLEVEEESDFRLGDMLNKFGEEFPKTTEFSRYARETMDDVRCAEDPDNAIEEWMNRELMLFQTLERHIVKKRLSKGFDEDVEQFLKFSLSVQNRRKSRAGRALENHLEFLFIRHKISYAREAQTEGRSRPDFIFPGIENYRDNSFPAKKLFMLGVKTSCKDRWRQVIAEAARINPKHLLTLQPGISVHQTTEMESLGLHLVIPRGIHESYAPEQRKTLLTISDFVALIKAHQNNS